MENYERNEGLGENAAYEEAGAQGEGAARFGQTLGKALRVAGHFVKKTVFIVKKGEDTLFTMPTIACVVLLLFFWQMLLPIMGISLFFDVRYSFDGTESVKKANTVLDKASEFADDVRSEFRK